MQKKHHVNIPRSSSHLARPPSVEHAGKLFRVRDKNDASSYGKVWAVNLPWEEADKLKTQLAANGKSRTVRCEEMGIANAGDPPEGNPDGQWVAPNPTSTPPESTSTENAVAAPQSAPKAPRPIPKPDLGNAFAAATGAAADAQKRHDALKAKQAKQDADLKRLEEQRAELAQMAEDLDQSGELADDVDVGGVLEGLDLGNGDISAEDLAHAEALASAPPKTDTAPAS